MKIQGNVTMLFNSDGLKVEVRDTNASIKFLEFKLSPEEVCKVFSRLSEIPVELEIRALENIGKTMQIDKLEFEFPEYKDILWKDRYEVAYKKALTVCPEGWHPDNYFGSKDSFFEKNGKQYASCTIRKWI